MRTFNTFAEQQALDGFESEPPRKAPELFGGQATDDPAVFARNILNSECYRASLHRRLCFDSLDPQIECLLHEMARR